MKRDYRRVMGFALVLLIGVGLGVFLSRNNAQVLSVADASFGGDGRGKLATEPAKVKLPVDLARDRTEIMEEDGKYTITIHFPNKTDPKRTRWRITASVDKAGTLGGPRENLVVHYAFFQPAPDVPEIQVLGQTYLAESLVAYSDGVRYYDIGHHDNGILEANAAELGDHGFPLDRKKQIICELRNRGLHWKEGRGEHHSRRGEELVLWGTLKAANYLYVIHFGFHDDGTIQCKMGSTGSNLTDHIGPSKSHTHIAYWRVDIDLGNRTSNEAYLVRHREPWGGASKSTQVIEAFNGGCSGFADWNDKEFTVLRIMNPKMKGAHGRAVAYDLISNRTGSARHFGTSPDERFTHHDFYVMAYKQDKGGAPDQVDCTKLCEYVRGGEDLKGKDIVLWHATCAHHIPRQEDMFGGSTGATSVVWSGFDLKPRDLFPSTPFYGAARAKK